MALSLPGRALHFVFKIGDRKATAHFYKDILGMQILRHEEFSEGCAAACNGQYANRWSKTMVGYGPESSHFVIELTYNYEVKAYELGNDFLGITIKSKEVLQRAKNKNMSIKQIDDYYAIRAPGGYEFHILDESLQKSKDPVHMVTLASSNLVNTIRYWNGILGMKIVEKSEKSVSFVFHKDQCILKFKEIEGAVNHGKSYGRIAFAVPKKYLPEIQKKIESEQHKVLTPMITLDTPGKASVTVVILADPDDHEICFVDEEGFRELSKVDPGAEAAFEKALKMESPVG